MPNLILRTGNRVRRLLTGGFLLLAALLLLGAPPGSAEEPTAQSTFDTPEAAVQALREALEKDDEAALAAIFGPDARELARDPKDPVVQRERKEFLSLLKEKTGILRPDETTAELVVGRNDWPFPVPIVLADGKWFFDTAAGKDEILARRIGENELTAIRICLAFVEAQAAYAAVDRDGDRVREFAQRLVSSEGLYDGLYWPADPENDVEESPLGEGVEDLEAFLADRERTTPFNGYYWKILTGQGANAPGGAHSFVVNGNMIAGFALVGVPAQHGQSGVKTLLVSHHGRILEKDLGEGSLQAAQAMTVYDPDETWTDVSPEDRQAAETDR